jgi:ABC-type phosphate transport system substrate-binding protein
VLAVIVNKSNPASTLEKNDLRPIFQTTKKAWGTGEDAVPINLPEDSPLRADFDQAVLGLDRERVARYWTDRKVRGGARPPVRVPTTAAVLKAVASKPGAIGYVKLSEVNGTVKVVAKIVNGKLQ